MVPLPQPGTIPLPGKKKRSKTVRTSKIFVGGLGRKTTALLLSGDELRDLRRDATIEMRIFVERPIPSKLTDDARAPARREHHIGLDGRLDIHAGGPGRGI